MGIAWKEPLKSLKHSYFQERVLSWEHILNQECVSSSDFLCMYNEPKLKDRIIVNDIRHNNIGKQGGKNMVIKA